MVSTHLLGPLGLASAVAIGPGHGAVVIWGSLCETGMGCRSWLIKDSQRSAYAMRPHGRGDNLEEPIAIRTVDSLASRPARTRRPGLLSARPESAGYRCQYGVSQQSQDVMCPAGTR
jgi:hypothetical protein